MTPEFTTDRLAEIRARLADLDAKIKLRSENAERGIVTPLGAAADRLHQYAPMDLEFLLSLVNSLRERLDTAEGQLAEIRENQIGLARGFLHDAEAQRKRAKRLDDQNLTHAEGTVHGAVTALQVLLVLTGEVEYDEEADAVWELVSRKDGSGVDR